MEICFDIEKLQEILVEFNNFSGLRISVIDVNSKEILSYPKECEICNSFNVNYNCSYNNNEVSTKSSDTIIKMCNLGILEITTPFYYNDQLTGYIILSEIVDELNFDVIKTNIIENFGTKAAEKYLSNKLVMNQSKLTSYISIVNMCILQTCISSFSNNYEQNIIKEINNYIDVNIDGKITISNICKVVHIGRTTLFNIFSKEYKMGVMEYITFKRINNAKKLLASTNSTIKEISTLCGFNNQNYFSRTFKKHIDKSPLAYRISIKNMETDMKNTLPKILFKSKNKYNYDFGKKVTGYIRLEYSVIDEDIEVEFVSGPVTTLMPTLDKITLKKGSTLFLDNSYTACRYINITTSKPIDIISFDFINSQYPVENKGDFKTNDEMLNKIWEMGAYTVELCSQKNSESLKPALGLMPEEIKKFIKEWQGSYGDYVFFDGPRRDREAWLGDIRTEALVTFSAFGDYTVAKNSIKLFCDLQKENGLTCGSGATWQDYIEYNFWLIVSVWECYLYSGDINFLKEMYPYVIKLINYIFANIDERGFIENDGNWMWTLPREGYSSAAMCVLYQALLASVNIENSVQNKVTPLSDKILELSKKVKENINKYFWDEKLGIYRDNFRLITDEPIIALDVNCFAITQGIADAQQQTRILDYIKKNMWCEFGSTTIDKKITNAVPDSTMKKFPLKQFLDASNEPDKMILSLIYPHNKMIWPFVNAYEVEARLLCGDLDSAFELIKLCWGNSAYDETGTFWEMYDIEAKTFAPRAIFEQGNGDCNNSAAHGWSGWISHIMISEIAGIKPLEPGFKKVLICPKIGNLKNINATMPTPRGDIKVNIISNNNEVIVNYTVPKDVCVEINLDFIKNKNIKCVKSN